MDLEGGGGGKTIKMSSRRRGGGGGGKIIKIVEKGLRREIKLKRERGK